MSNRKLLVAVFIALQFVAVGAGWWYFLQAQSSQQQQLQQLATPLTEYLLDKPEVNAEMLARAQELTGLSQLALSGADGSIRVAVGVEPQNATSLQVALTDGRQLTLVAPKVSFPWWWGLIAAVFGVAVWLSLALQERRLQRSYQRLWQTLSASSSSKAKATGDIDPLITEITQVLQQRTVLKDELQALQLQLQKTELDHQQHARELVQQLDLAQKRQAHLSYELQCWHLLAGHSAQMSEAELQQWLTLLLWCRQSDNTPRPVVQNLSSWFARSLRQIQQSWPPHMVLLPDEDPAATRCQVVMDGDLLQHLMFALLQVLRPLVDGQDVLLSYRLETGTRDKLQLRIQYTGRSLSTRSRQILLQGACAEPQWNDVPVELCHLLVQQLGADLQIQELADLGTRILCNIPVIGRDQQQTKRFQSLAVLDSHPGRLDIWRHSLLGVSEQVVAAATIEELKQVLHSRLIDTVVIHQGDNSFDPDDYQQLLQLSMRYQLVVFTNPSAQAHFQAMTCAALFNSPLVLADLQDLPQPGCQFANQQLLIVDDNQTNLSFVRAMLEGQGINIDFALTGQEALKLASNSRYQLILMDIQLPDLSGVEVTKRIRQLRHHQQTIIMAFTGHALPEEAASFRLAGMDDVMIKPLDARKIAHILSRVRPLAETQ